VEKGLSTSIKRVMDADSVEKGLPTSIKPVTDDANRVKEGHAGDDTIHCPINSGIRYVVKFARRMANPILWNPKEQQCEEIIQNTFNIIHEYYKVKVKNLEPDLSPNLENFLEKHSQQFQKQQDVKDLEDFLERYGSFSCIPFSLLAQC